MGFQTCHKDVLMRQLVKFDLSNLIRITQMNRKGVHKSRQKVDPHPLAK